MKHSRGLCFESPCFWGLGFWSPGFWGSDLKLWVLVLDYACQMSKNIVLKNKATCQLILFVHKEKNHPEIIKINITNCPFN